MRHEVSKEIYQAALTNKEIFFLTGDLNHGSLKDFRKNIPEQHINVGIAEQNLIGIATGLALSGKKVFTFSIMPFITLRCLEQIRDDVCGHNVDVTVIGDGHGYYYSKSGLTHICLEDVSIMRTLPGLKIVSPADPEQARQLVQQIISGHGPFYLRLGGKITPKISELWENDCEPPVLNKGQVVVRGTDLTIFSTGVILSEAIEASRILKAFGFSAEVVNFHTIKPLDKDMILDRLFVRRAIFVLEEHTIVGGLGSAISEVIISEIHKKPIIFKNFGINDQFVPSIGSRKNLWQINGITGPQIAESISVILS